MKLKQKLKAFFKTKDSSEDAVEFLRMFLIPFIKHWDSNASVDDAIGAFFDVNNRKFYDGRALRPFQMPGLLMLKGNRPVKRTKHRSVLLGQRMLIAADRRTQTTRVDITIDQKYLTFRLTRAETEFLKDYVELKES